MRYLAEQAESLKKKEIERIEELVNQIEEAEKSEWFNDPWLKMIRMGMFDYPNLIKY